MSTEKLTSHLILCSLAWVGMRTLTLREDIIDATIQMNWRTSRKSCQSLHLSISMISRRDNPEELLRASLALAPKRKMTQVQLQLSK
jgi:hypothetical protein